MLGTMLASQQGGLPPGTQLGTKAGGGPQDKPKMAGLQLIEKLVREYQQRSHVKAQREAARQRARAEAEGEQDEMQVDEAAAEAAEAEHGMAGGLGHEPEPEVYDEAVIKGVELKPLNLSTLDLDDLGLESSEAALAYRLLLQQGGVVAVQGGDGAVDPDVLRLLWDSVVRGEGALGGLAAAELMGYYARMGPVEEPRWVPTVSDMYDALCMLGYRGVDAGSGAPSSSARSSRRRSSTGNSGAAAGAGAAGGVEAAGAPPSATQLMNLKQLLGVVARLCALHKRRPGGLLEFSRSTLVPGTKLLTALLELQLCRSTTRVALQQLCDATGGLMDAWGRPGVESDYQAAAADDAVWESLVAQVAAKVVRVGPTDQARVHLVYNTPGSGPRQAQLQRAIGLQLLHSILEKPAGSSKRAAAPEDALTLLRKLAPRPELLFKVVQIKGEDKPDYWRLISVVEVTHAVVWNAVYEGSEGADGVVGGSSSSQAPSPAHQLAAEWKEFVKAMSNGLRSSGNPTATKLRALLSAVINHLEFGVLSSDAGFS